MDEETLKNLYKNSCWLIKELANMFSKMEIKNNIFEIANENFENTVEKKDLDLGFVYSNFIAIILKNYSHFNEKFEMLDWNLSLEDLNLMGSSIDHTNILEYLPPEKKECLLKKQKEDREKEHEKFENEIFNIANIYTKQYKGKNSYYVSEENAEMFKKYYGRDEDFIEEYNKYLKQKYKGSQYNPDDLELITFYQQIEDEYLEEPYLSIADIQTNLLHYTAELYNNEKYDETISTIPSILKNENGELDINKFIHYFRNAIAHNQFSFTEEAAVDGITIGIQINDVNYFDFFISYPDLQLILKKYIHILLSKSKESENTPILKRIYSSLFNNPELDSTEEIYDEISFEEKYDMEDVFDVKKDGYKKVKELIRREFKKLGIENHFFELAIMAEAEMNLYNFVDYGDEDIDDIDYDNSFDICMKDILYIIKLFEYIEKYIINNINKFNELYKISEILDILVNLNNVLYEMVNYNYKGNKRLLPELIDEIKKYDYKEINPDFSNLSVLLNVLLVQCSYENVDKDSIDLSRLTLNKEYFESKKNSFEPLIDKLNTKCEVLDQRINKLMEAINSGKTSNDKIEFVNKMKEDKEQLQNNINKIKKEWNNSLNLSNNSIFNHIRNAFAHGSYFIPVPKNGQDLKTINITIKDYEPETNKLTFSGTISIYDLLSQILKPEIINQLFPDRSFNKMMWYEFYSKHFSK